MRHVTPVRSASFKNVDRAPGPSQNFRSIRRTNSVPLRSRLTIYSPKVLFNPPITMIRYLLVVLCIGIVATMPKVKRQSNDADTYVLPSGAELIVGPIKTTFSCEGLPYGYYSDIDNACKIFHVCVPVSHPDGTAETFRYSFFCGNQTVFDQSQLICTYDQDSIECDYTNEWRYLNDFFGNVLKQFYPRKAIPDQRPQGSVESAPNVERRNKK